MEDEPSVTLGPLKIWVHGRQFSDSHDYWDGNWLSATARCEGAGSRVEVTGSFLHLGELKRWKADLEIFHGSISGVVELPTLEPTLKVKVEGRGSATGAISCEVEITGDNINELHRFWFGADQSYIPGLLSQLAAILRRYPIRP